MTQRRLAIVDGLSLVGKELRRRIARGAAGGVDVVLLDRDERVGTVVETGGEPTVVGPVDDGSLAEADLVAVCGGAELVKPHLAALAAADTAVVDLTAELAARSGSEPRVVPVPAPPESLFAELVAAIAATVEIAEAHGCAFEPACARGEGGIEELHEQTVAVLNFRPAPTATLAARLAFDLVPSAHRTVAAGDLTVIRVPVFLGLGLLLQARCAASVSRTALDRALVAAGIEVAAAGDDPPTPGELAGDEAPEAIRAALLTPDGDAPDGDVVRLWAVDDYAGRHAASALACLGDRFSGTGSSPKSPK